MDKTFALNVNGTFYAATVRRQFLATRAEHPNTQAWGRRKAPNQSREAALASAITGSISS
jgi:hypothetical protein